MRSLSPVLVKHARLSRRGLRIIFNLTYDEWLLDHPDESMRGMLLELLERRYDSTSTVFCTQYAKKDWHQRLGPGVHADAIMDRIVHNTIWVDTGTHNMREQAMLNQ